MASTNLFYYNPEVVDLAKLREQALRAAWGVDYLASEPQDAIIHHHGEEDVCTDRRHDRYKARAHEAPASKIMIETHEHDFDTFTPKEARVGY
jgi:hypothetical protein